MKRALKNFSRGSILAYSLILLGIVLTASIGMMSASVTNLKTVSLSDKSINAFQIADSGSQAVIKELKAAADGDKLSDIDGGSCNNSTKSIDKDLFLEGRYRVTFFDASDPAVQLGCGADVSDVASVKSVGTYGDTARAVQVVVQSIKPIGWWKFNNNADDETSGANDGSLSGSPLPTFVDAPSFANRALYINSGSGVVTINNESNFDLRRTISISLWLKADTLPPAGSMASLVSKMDSSGTVSSRAYSVWLNGFGFVHLTSSNSSGTEACTDTADSVINLNTWYHYVGVIDRDNGSMKIYVNGVLQTPGSAAHHCGGSGTFSAGDDAADNDEPVRVGGDFGSSYSVFDGQIDDVRIYNGILSVSDISLLYNGGSGRE